MRVCLITAYDLSRDGGVNRQVLGLAHALRSMGDEAVVLGPASGQVPQGCVGLEGVVGVPGNGSMAHLGLRVARAATLGFLRAHPFDIAHLHAPLLPGPARQAAAYARLPMVGTFHSSTERESKLSRCVRQLACTPLARLRAGIAVSEVAKRFARPIYGGPWQVIPCGIAAGPTPPALPAPPAPFARALRVLFVGRFCEPRKGLRYLLLAAIALRRMGYPVEVEVVGAGRRHKFAQLAHAARARFLGRLDDAALWQHYRSADVFCAPSVGSESFGLVLIEAMAHGCPVVASSIAGYVEAAQGSARFVAPKAVDALAMALWQVGHDAALRNRLHAAGAARAAALDWSQVAPKVRQVYHRALLA